MAKLLENVPQGVQVVIPLRTNVRAVVTLAANSGNPKDSITMDFAFAAPDVSLDSVLVGLFNTTASGNTSPLMTYLSPWISGSTLAHSIRFYDVSGHLHGDAANLPPFATSSFTAASRGTSGLPNEIAGVVSFHADYSNIPEHAGNTRPKARYRGRVFVGPLASNNLSTDATTKRPYWDPNYRGYFANAFKQLLALEPSWSVWSRVDGAMRPVIGGYIDDAFDVQRRRGELPIARTSWP